MKVTIKGLNLSRDSSVGTNTCSNKFIRWGGVDVCAGGGGKRVVVERGFQTKCACKIEKSK